MNKSDKKFLAVAMEKLKATHELTLDLQEMGRRSPMMRRKVAQVYRLIKEAEDQIKELL